MVKPLSFNDNDKGKQIKPICFPAKPVKEIKPLFDDKSDPLSKVAFDVFIQKFSSISFKEDYVRHQISTLLPLKAESILNYGSKTMSESASISKEFSELLSK